MCISSAQYMCIIIMCHFDGLLLLPSENDNDGDNGGLPHASQVVLAMLGFPAAILLPIPKFIGIDYRSILQRLDKI